MNLLITHEDIYTVEDKEKLRSIGYNVFFTKDEDEKMDEKTLGIKLSDIDAIVGYTLFKNNDISNFPNLKFIKTYSAGLDQLPHDYINKHDIIVENAKDVFSIPIAEYTVMKVLEIAKSTKAFYINQENKLWNTDEKVCEITDKSVLIIGCGSIGRETAKRLKPFVLKISGVVRKNIDEDSKQYVDEFYYQDRIESLIPESDIIILALPYSESSHHIIDENMISLMKDEAILINVARGKIIDENALIAALEKGKFSGVALDVTYDEPLSEDSPLWDFDNVSITPHSSYKSAKNGRRQVLSVYSGVKNFYDNYKK